MSQDKEATRRFELFKSLREVRDSMGADLAKLAIALTTTGAYQRFNAVLGKPVLLASALLREKREALMSDMLAQLNMPSREDVLTLSQRLTRIEMTLDDLGAGMDQLRRTTSRPQRATTREVSSSDVRPSNVLAALTPAAPKSKEA